MSQPSTPSGSAPLTTEKVIPAIPVFAESFGVSAFWATAVVSVFALVRLVSAIPSGKFVDRFGERGVLTVGLAIVAVSSLLAGLSTSYVQLLLLRGIGGFGSAMFTVSSFGLLIRVVAPELRARAAGTYQSGFLVGTLLGPAVGALVSGASVRVPFFVYAGTLGIAAIVAGTMLASTHLRDRDVITEEPGWAAVKAALRLQPYRTALSVNFAGGFAVFGLRSALVPLFVIMSLGATQSLSYAGFFLSAVVTLALLWPAGRMSDLRGRKPPVVIGTLLSLIALLMLAASDGPVLFLAAMAVLGAAGAFLGSAPAAIVADVGGGRRSGRIVATYQMSSDFGNITGPLVGGAILTLTGSFSWGFILGAVVVAMALVMSIRMPETHSPQTSAVPEMSPDDDTGQTSSS